MFSFDKYESFQIRIHTGNHHMPVRRETFNGAHNYAIRSCKAGKHGVVDGVWFDENGIHFDRLMEF